jgi:GWxTD domain-containing protein
MVANCDAQLVAFAKPQLIYNNNKSYINQHLAVQTSYNNSISIKCKYFKNNICMDSFTSYCNTEPSEYIGRYWCRTIQHGLAAGRYKSMIIITELNANKTWQTDNEINIEKENNENYLTPMLLWFEHSDAKIRKPLIGDFCDSTVNQLKMTSQIIHTQHLDSVLYCYTRLTKRGKPNHILFSKVDTFTTKDVRNSTNTFNYETFIPLHNLSSGNINVSLSLYQNKTLLQRQETFFQCIRPNVVAIVKPIVTIDNFSEQVININNSFIHQFKNDVMIRNILSLQPIVTPTQFKVIVQLVQAKDDTTIRRYFYNFWSIKNEKNPEAAWKQYSTLLNDCVKKFGGINNDRAITYLRYGKPDKIEEVPNEPNTIPYEIWQYENINEDKNVVFLYIQSKGIDNQKQLLHCSMKTEKQYPQWRNLLIRGEENNNRALEYLQINGDSR